ncbi:MAG: hypothetical protein E7610_07215 [Ruminococcaceae bacterium]|nr:hypothetical protein [Oscillospiraceae bacterium]
MKQVTIATYNIRHGADVGLDWSRLGEIIRRSGADIVGLQEVDMHTNRVGSRDTLSGMIEATGLPHGLFVPAIDFDGGQYGTAILSRYPMVTAEVQPLSSAGYEPRAFGCVMLETEDGGRLCFLNTHLSYESVEQQSIQFGQIAAWVNANVDKTVPIVLTGDFNTEDFSAFSPVCDLGFSLVNNPETTYKSFRTNPMAIDNIAYRGIEMTPVEQGMIDSDRSDHNLLWCRFEMA